jgi:hypothetical protein
MLPWICIYFVACERQNPNAVHQVQKLLDCLSILFTFHRLPIDDIEMLENLQQWTERMVCLYS